MFFTYPEDVDWEVADSVEAHNKDQHLNHLQDTDI